MANDANTEKRIGTRCAVCVQCGRCFEDESLAAGDNDVSVPRKWTGTRCDVCVSCGKCAEAWGLIPADDSDADSGPTNWADAFKVMDIGTASAPPPVTAAPGQDGSAIPEKPASQAEGDAPHAQKPSSFACLKRGADDEDPDTSTGATPGVSAACKEHGFDDMEAVIADRGIKPPGVA